MRRLYSTISAHMQRLMDEVDEIRSRLWIMRLSDIKPTQRQQSLLDRDSAVREVRRMAQEAAQAIQAD